jgi:hypothetical protein
VDVTSSVTTDVEVLGEVTNSVTVAAGVLDVEAARNNVNNDF